MSAKIPLINVKKSDTIDNFIFIATSPSYGHLEKNASLFTPAAISTQCLKIH